jgi:excisionase family DNA binding protein
VSLAPATKARIRAALDAFADELIDALDAGPGAAVDEPDRLLNVDEARALLNVARSTVYAEMDAGRLRSLKVGKRRLVPSSAIAEFIAEHGAKPQRGRQGA